MKRTTVGDGLFALAVRVLPATMQRSIARAQASDRFSTMRLARIATTLVPALSSAFVFVVLFVVWRWLQIGASLSNRALIPLKAGVAIDEYRAQLFWAVSAVTFAVLMAWNIVLSLTIILRHAQSGSRFLLASIGSVGALLLLAFVAHWNVAGTASIALVRGVIAEKTGLRMLNGGVNDKVGVIAVALVITAACSLISRNPDEMGIDTKQLADRLRDARVSVYASCALLAAAVAEIYLFFLWPASFSYVATVDQEFVRQLAATVSVAAGCVFTLLLLVVFVPVWVIHARWIDAAAHSAYNGEGWDREKWLKQFDLRNTSLSWLGPAISTLAPALLGLIPKLLASSQ